MVIWRSLNAYIIICYFLVFTSSRKKRKPIDIDIQICPGGNDDWYEICLGFSETFIKEMIYNSTTCGCSFYGFKQETCADVLFDDDVKGKPDSNVTIDSILNYSNDIMRNFGLFITKYGHCHSIETSTRRLNIPVIDSCPENSSSINSNMCLQTPDTSPPVEYHEYFSVVFKNIYCALCHGLALEFVRTNFNSWSVIYDCKNGKPATPRLAQELTALGQCVVKFQTPNNYDEKLKNCKTLHESLLDINWNECKYCDHSMNRTSGCYMCRFSYIGFNQGCYAPAYRPNIRILFDFTMSNKAKFNGRILNRNEVCENDELFDNILQICRKIICLFGEYVLNGRCVQNTTVALDPQTQPLPGGTEFLTMQIRHHYESQYKDLTDAFRTRAFVELLSKDFIIVSSNITESIIKVVDSHNITDNDSKIEWFNSSNIINGGSKNVSVNLTSNSYDDAVEKETDVFLQLDLSSKSVKELVEYIGQLKINQEDKSMIEMELSNFPVYQNACTGSGSLQCSSEGNLVFIDDWLIEFVRENRTFIAPFFTSMVRLNIDIQMSTYNLSNFCFCLPQSMSYSTNCSYERVNYNSTEFTIAKDGVLLLKHLNLQFTTSEYELVNTGAIICINTQHINHFFNMDPIQTYVSLACTALSVVALIITLILYSIYKELRNLPGKLTMGLSISLIVGQVLLVFPDLQRAACRYVAVIAHYSWLTVFLWMGAVAVNMLITFHPRSMHSASSWRSQTAFKRYAAICLGTPLLFCLILLILDLVPGSHLHVNYGQATCTWMSSLDGYIYMFFVPVGIVLTLDVVCFSLTLYYISSTMAASDKITGRKRDRDRCVIYLKLASVMGFSWIFGFVAGFSNVEALWYVYIVLNGLQGLFIFFSFGMTSRNRKMVMESFKKKSRYMENVTNTTSFTTRTASNVNSNDKSTSNGNSTCITDVSQRF